MMLHTYSDGGARGNPGPSGIGVVVCDENDQVLEEQAQCIGDGTNNVAEYRAMILALELAKKRGGTTAGQFAAAEAESGSGASGTFSGSARTSRS